MLNNVVVRKGKQWGLRYVKQFLDAGGSAENPVFINSFPKSGTHLLYQLFEAREGLRDFGEFIASTPSFTLRERSVSNTVEMLQRIQPGEVFRGHLFFHDEFEQVLAARQVRHFFIYRDPRDVVCSEAHYLSRMNRWHKMHRRFSQLPSDEARIELSILGEFEPRAKAYYPSIGVRMGRYLPWLKSPGVLPIRFEELVGEGRREVISKVGAHLLGASGLSNGRIESFVTQAIGNIAPERSHTFRSGGGAGKWRERFTPRHKKLFKASAGDLLIELGYEASTDW
jgi:sulfotransferase 6B1